MWDNESGQTQPLLKKHQEDYGQSYTHDPSFKGVKEEGRKWNDILFALLFIATCVGMVSVSSFAFSKGNPSRLIPSWDFASVNISADATEKSELWFQDAVAQMKNDRDILGGALAFTIILATLWIQLLKKYTKFFIYATLALGLLVVVAAGIYSFSLGVQKHSEAARYTSYGLFALVAVLLIAIFFFRNKIALTCELFKECCSGVQWNPAIFLVVGVVIVGYALFTVYWVASFVYLYSVPKEDKYQIPHTPTKFDQSVRNLMYYQVFAYFWVTSFLSAVFQMSVAGAIATWYFSRDVNGYNRNYGSPALRSFTRALTKSFGSLALGSLVLAVIRFINFLLRMAQKKSKATKNVVVTFILRCVTCLFGCVERLVKFIDRFAYIYIAMHGDGFCSSARGVFNLMSRNMFDAMFVDLFGEFILFVGRLFGAAATTLLTLALIHGLGREISGITLTVVIVVSFAVFTIFGKIVGTGVDTVFVCYLEDMERNKDGGMYVSPELHNMLQNKMEAKRKVPLN